MTEDSSQIDRNEEKLLAGFGWVAALALMILAGFALRAWFASGLGLTEYFDTKDLTLLAAVALLLLTGVNGLQLTHRRWQQEGWSSAILAGAFGVIVAVGLVALLAWMRLTS